MKIKNLALCILFGAASIAACAQDSTLRIGVAHVAIHSDSPNLSSNGPAFLTPQPAGITIANADTLVIAYTRKINTNWDLDLELGIPPRHDVNGTGTLAPFGVVSRVKQAAPTMFFNYNFGPETSAFRPFLGIGVNYTVFFDAQSTAAGNLASGGPTKIKLSDSVGVAGQVGASYKLGNQWSLVGSIAAADVQSDLTATTGSIERKTHIKFKPVAYTLGMAYRY